VITASVPSWIEPFTGLSSRCFGKLVASVRREQAADQQRGRPWSLLLEDRVLLVTAYWRTNLTMRQLALLFGISKSAADRIIDHIGPLLALRRRKQFRKDTVLIVDGTLVPTRDHSVAEQSKNYRYSTAHQVVIDADSRLVVVVGGPCRETGTTPAAGRSPGPRLPSATQRLSPTAATRAPVWSSRTAAVRARNSRPGRRSTTAPTNRSAPASSTPSPG
jgi:hypothetical protein